MRCAFAFLLGSVLLLGTGCAPVVIGALAVGAVGGYVVSPDTVAGSTSNAFGEVWDAAMEITGIMGAVQEEDERSGYIVALINGSRVTVTLLSVNSTTTKLSVKARKSFMPKVDLAQDVYAKIINAADR